MAYIRVGTTKRPAVGTANDFLKAEGQVWPDGITDAEVLGFIERASRRIDQLAFAPEHEVAYSPRYVDGFLNDGTADDVRKVDAKRIPYKLAVEVALLALWYAQNPHGFYNQSPAGEESLCKQMSDLPLSIQAGLWSFVSDEVKIDADELPDVQLDRSQAGSLYDAQAQAVSADQQPAPTGGGLNEGQVNLLIAAYYAAHPPSWNALTGKPNLATVATSGDYDDLTDKPTIPNLNGSLDLNGATFEYVDADKTLYLVVNGNRVGAIEVFEV